MTNKEMLETLAETVRERLFDIYGGGITFDPVIVENKTDRCGEDYLHVYVVFDGDEKLLQSKWPAVFWSLIDADLEEFGVKQTPHHSVAKKSEWDKMIADGRCEIGAFAGYSRPIWRNRSPFESGARGRAAKKAEEMRETLAGLVKARLSNIFEGKITFDPVIVENKTDIYGEDYLHIYVVFDGDEKLLESKWPLVPAWLIDAELEEFGVEETPCHSFSKKSEWDELIAEGLRES